MRSSSISRPWVGALLGGLYSMYVFHEHVLGRVITSRVRKRKRKLELEQSRARAEKAHFPGGVDMHYSTLHTHSIVVPRYVRRACHQTDTYSIRSSCPVPSRPVHPDKEKKKKKSHLVGII